VYIPVHSFLVVTSCSCMWKPLMFLSCNWLNVVLFSDKHSAKVTSHMLDIMIPLISEADSVSQDLLDVVLGCILEPFKVSCCICRLSFMLCDILKNMHVCFLLNKTCILLSLICKAHNFPWPAEFCATLWIYRSAAETRTGCRMP